MINIVDMIDMRNMSDMIDMRDMLDMIDMRNMVDMIDMRDMVDMIDMGTWWTGVPLNLCRLCQLLCCSSASLHSQL